MHVVKRRAIVETVARGREMAQDELVEKPMSRCGLCRAGEPCVPARRTDSGTQHHRHQERRLELVKPISATFLTRSSKFIAATPRRVHRDGRRHSRARSAVATEAGPCRRGSVRAAAMHGDHLDVQVIPASVGLLLYSMRASGKWTCLSRYGRSCSRARSSSSTLSRCGAGRRSRRGRDRVHGAISGSRACARNPG